MSDPIIYIIASAALLGIGFLIGRLSSALDRQDRVDDEHSRSLREVWMRAIADTREQFLDILALVEVIADGDVTRGLLVAQRYYSNRHPAAWADLVADPDLVDELCTTFPEIMERGWGKSKGGTWSLRTGTAGHRIRDASGRTRRLGPTATARHSRPTTAPIGRAAARARDHGQAVSGCQRERRSSGLSLTPVGPRGRSRSLAVKSRRLSRHAGAGALDRVPKCQCVTDLT